MVSQQNFNLLVKKTSILPRNQIHKSMRASVCVCVCVDSSSFSTTCVNCISEYRWLLDQFYCGTLNFKQIWVSTEKVSHLSR